MISLLVLCIIETILEVQGKTYKCNELLTSRHVFGYNEAYGIDLSFLKNNLLWIGCADACKPNQFYCTDSSTSLSFGTSSTKALRAALVSSGSAFGCCSCGASNTNCIFNAPDDPYSATALCNQLGYDSGSVSRIDSNICPEVHWNNSAWTSDWINTSGGGKSFTCSGVPTISPTEEASSSAPTPNPTNPNYALVITRLNIMFGILGVLIVMVFIMIILLISWKKKNAPTSAVIELASKMLEDKSEMLGDKSSRNEGERTGNLLMQPVLN